jgi:hypothetical protein
MNGDFLSQHCIFALTRSRSALLKRGTLNEVLDKHFTFVSIRMAKLSIGLQHLLENHEFMDQKPPVKDCYKKSTFHRWQDQVSECTPHCTCHCYL